MDLQMNGLGKVMLVVTYNFLFFILDPKENDPADVQLLACHLEK